jgi:hypothetical protein
MHDYTTKFTTLTKKRPFILAYTCTSFIRQVQHLLLYQKLERKAMYNIYDVISNLIWVLLGITKGNVVFNSRFCPKRDPLQAHMTIK